MCGGTKTSQKDAKKMWRVKVWVRTVCTILALVQVKPLHLNVLKLQVFLVWWGWEDSRCRGGFSPTSLGAAAWQQPQRVWGYRLVHGPVGTPDGPPGQKHRGPDLPVFLHSMLMDTCCSWKPQVRQQLCRSSRRGRIHSGLCR